MILVTKNAWQWIFVCHLWCAMPIYWSLSSASLYHPLAVCCLQEHCLTCFYRVLDNPCSRLFVWLTCYYLTVLAGQCTLNCCSLSSNFLGIFDFDCPLSSVSTTSCIHRLHNFWSSPDWLLRCVLQCEEFASLSLKVIIYDIRGLYKLSLVTNKLFVYYCLLCLWSLVYVCSNFPSISCCLLSQITKYKIGSSRICFLYSPHVTSTGEFGLPSDHSFTGIARSLMNVLALFCLGRTCHYLCVTKF